MHRFMCSRRARRDLASSKSRKVGRLGSLLGTERSAHFRMHERQNLSACRMSLRVWDRWLSVSVVLSRRDRSCAIGERPDKRCRTVTDRLGVSNHYDLAEFCSPGRTPEFPSSATRRAWPGGRVPLERQQSIATQRDSETSQPVLAAAHGEEHIEAFSSR